MGDSGRSRDKRTRNSPSGRSVSRRKCLATSGLGASVVLAGCNATSGDEQTGTPTGSSTTETETSVPTEATPTATPTESDVERATSSDRTSPLGDGTPATMADYWNGDATWSFVRRDADISYNGSHVWVAEDGTWYLFNRTSAPQSTCDGFPGMGTEVRESTDRGETWSDPVDIISPEPDTPYACAATDGDVWYDPEDEVWHYLFQGLDEDGWSGCLLSREGTDPMGEFTIEPADGNPVIEAGQLWDQICTDPEDDCSDLAGGPGYVYDEGTFDIFDYDGEHYWVSFHGYDGRRGYRGIAKTPDFETWIAGNPDRGVPTDAVHDKRDADNWREDWAPGGSIGCGQATMLQEGDYYYHLVEASDINLACTPGQNWDYGLFRSTSLTDTDWEQYPKGNPIVYSSKGETGDYTMCNVQYAGLIRDPDTGFVYMKFGRRSDESEYDAIHWYRLETDHNRLTNATLWRADSHGWNARDEEANVTVYRHPNETPDGTQHMAVDCGGSCEGAHSVYQDVTVPSEAGDELEYGGMFMSEGERGALTVAVHQLDGDGDVVRTDRYPIETGTEWATYGTAAPLDAASETLRYEFQLDSARTYRATDMYLRFSGDGA